MFCKGTPSLKLGEQLHDFLDCKRWIVKCGRAKWCEKNYIDNSETEELRSEVNERRRNI